MLVEETGKAVAKTRAKPELVTIGSRQVISTGKWNDELMADYIVANATEKWLGIGELARVAYGQNTLNSKRMARNRLSTVFRHLVLNRGLLLVVEYENRRAKNVKLYDPSSPLERQLMAAILERRGSGVNTSLEVHERAIQLLGPDGEVS